MNFDLKLGKAAAVLFLALAMAGCGGGGGTTVVDPPPPDPAPIDVERMGISDAIAAASAAAGMVNDASTDEEVAAADMAVAAAVAAINAATLISGGEIATNRASLATVQSQLAAAKASRTMVVNLANQRMAISDAIAEATTAVRAVMDDSDDATVTAAEDAIAAASRAIAAAGDILASESAAARAEVADLQSDLDDAKSSRQMAMDDAQDLADRRSTQLSAITTAIDAATTAVGMVNDDSTQQQVDDANAKVAAATAAIAAAADLSDDEKDTHSASVSSLLASLNSAVTSRNEAIAARMLADQRMAISGAIDVAEAAVGAVMDDSAEATVTEAENAITAAREAIAAGTDVPADEAAANTRIVDGIASNLADAKDSRTAAIAAAEKAARVKGQRDAISTAIDDAKAKVAAVNDESTDEQVMAADDAITAAEEAIAAGTDLPAGETDTASETVSMLETDLASAKSSREVAMGGAARDMRDQIIGKDRALEAAANLPAATTTGIPGEAAIIITRAPAAAARVTSAGYSESDDPALPNGSTWIGSHLTQTVAGVGTNHLFVYTDKELPTRIQFYNWDGDATTPSLYADTVTDALTAPADSSTVITPLGLTGGATGNLSAATADPTRFPQPQTPEEGSLRQPYPNNEDTDGNVANGLEQVSIPGNYNGAGGRYVCTGGTAATPCSVTVAPGGAYALVGTWTFVPELNSTAWIQDGGTYNGGGTATQLGEFMSFGWWLQEPTAPTGAYTFRYYADGTAYNLGAGNLAAGSATYNGRAAGKYVVQEVDDTGVTGGMAGQFVAAASLTATFNATGAGGTLEGTISGFESDNAGVDVSGWSVALSSQTLTDTTGTSVTSAGTNNDPTSATFDGATAMMGDQTAYGTWASQFFGQPATADAYPLGVGGTFQADNESASIAGAFGARR